VRVYAGCGMLWKDGPACLAHAAADAEEGQHGAESAQGQGAAHEHV